MPPDDFLRLEQATITADPLALLTHFGKQPVAPNKGYFSWSTVLGVGGPACGAESLERRTMS